MSNVVLSPPPNSARLHFRNGAVQEVSAAREGGASLKKVYEPIWEPDDVVRVEVPFGGRLFWEGKDGREGVVEAVRDGLCTEGACENIACVRYEMGLDAALGQLRKADSNHDVVLSIPPRDEVSHDSVTLVTQFTLSRITRFERMAAAWDGPLSAAIYLTDPSDIDALAERLNAASSLSSVWNKVTLTLVKPDHSVDEAALLRRLRYPINRLRNLAIAGSPSPYLLVVDVDFVPSPGMASIVSTRGIPILTQPSSLDAKSPTFHRTALVIPTFELAPGWNTTFPTTLEDLAALYSASPSSAVLTDPNAGHGPSQPDQLFAVPPHAPSRGTEQMVDSSWSFPLAFEPQWEPYYLLARASHPLYDERFTDQGGDKQSHALLLNALGYEFRVLRDVWVLHPPKYDRSEEEWPAARVARQRSEQANSEVDLEYFEDAIGETADLDDHFNLAAQKDETRFRYFQDFLPELERFWGPHFRWPGGAGAKEVGEATFGRARLRSTFGP
ncbi:hypothetical protein JCM11251_002451 [Rhodosporidiobolus azoricus]